jgi:hypothetical protein
MSRPQLSAVTPKVSPENLAEAFSTTAEEVRDSVGDASKLVSKEQVDAWLAGAEAIFRRGLERISKLKTPAP